MTMTKLEIETRFANNLARVDGLVGIYDELTGRSKGRPSVREADLLRAAVVLLHATLEDLLRSLEKLRLPTAAAESFRDLRFVRRARKEQTEKLTMVDLAAYRGQSVDEVFQVAIDEHLTRSNYNNVADIKAVLKRLAIPYEIPDVEQQVLAAMTGRRHLIAHRADGNPMSGRGQHGAQSIGKQHVSTWTDAVRSFGNQVLTKI